jgi:hypothetical protein|tara:strand:+ start:22794 stop:22961 length:168 start_codon:yes stop_codon:yes gene_type:complete
MLSQLDRRHRDNPVIDLGLKPFKAKGQIKPAHAKLDDITDRSLLLVLVDGEAGCL